MCPAADKLSAQRAVGQSGAEKQEYAPAESDYQTKQYRGVVVSLPPDGCGSHSPRPKVQDGNKGAENDADVEPPAIARLPVFLAAHERMVLGIFRCDVFQCFGIGNDKLS